MKIKRRFKNSVFLLVLILLSVPSTAQQFRFQPLPNLNGGNIHSIAKVGTVTLYAGTSNAIYRSDDDGVTWKKQIDGVNVTKIAVQSKDLILAATTKGLYESHGTKWEKISDFADKKITDVGVTSDGIVFVSVYSDGIYKASTGDFQFKKIENLGYASSEYLIHCDGHIVFVDLKMSVDTGHTWEDISKGFPEFEFLNVLATNMVDSVVYAGTNSGVYQYNFSNQSWDLKKKFYEAVMDLKLEGSKLYAATSGGVYVSKNGGESWQQVNLGLSSAYVQTICVLGDNMFAGTYYGLDKCPVGGTQWSKGDMGINEVSIYSLFMFNDKLLISSSKGVLLTDDDGQHWQATRREYNMAFNDHVYRFYESPRGQLFACTHTGMYFSYDAYHWTPIRGYSGQQINDCVYDRQGNFYKATYTGVYLSTDDGLSWTKPYTDNKFDVATCITVDSSKRIFVGTGYEGAYVSEDKGANWAKITTDTLDKIRFNKLLFGAGRMKDYIYAATAKGVYVCNIFYNSWSKSSMGGGHPYVNDLVRRPDGKFYAAASTGLYVSSDSCNTWQSVDMGDASSNLSAIVFDSKGNIYVGTSHNGVYTSKTSLTGINPAEENATAITLTNYPNPFQHTTRITYFVPPALEQMPVEIAVYDILGKKVRTLVRQQQQAGSHSVVFSTDNLLPGSYFCRMKIGSVIKVRKMLIVQ